MGQAVNAQGETYVSHTWTSPLDNQALMDSTCSACHADLRKETEELQEAMERDYRDSHREIAPLRQAEDAALLDTTELDEQESEAALLRLIRERVGQ